MKTYARLSDFGVPSLKVRRFAGTIKGEPVDRALAILALQNSPACQGLHKLLRSAMANAENNNGLTLSNLVVSNVMVDNGPTLKRIRPRARGRAYQILKRSCHVTIELDLSKEAKRRATATPVAGHAATPAPTKPAASKAAAPKAAAPKAAAPKAPKAEPKAAAAKPAAAPKAPKAAAKPASKGKA